MIGCIVASVRLIAANSFERYPLYSRKENIAFLLICLRYMVGKRNQKRAVMNYFMDLGIKNLVFHFFFRKLALRMVFRSHHLIFIILSCQNNHANNNNRTFYSFNC